MTPDAHHSLDGLTHVTTAPDGKTVTEEIAPQDLDATLREVFGLALTEEELKALAG